jgi:hypothetical protein
MTRDDTLSDRWPGLRSTYHVDLPIGKDDQLVSAREYPCILNGYYRDTWLYKWPIKVTLYEAWGYNVKWRTQLRKYRQRMQLFFGYDRFDSVWGYLACKKSICDIISNGYFRGMWMYEWSRKIISRRSVWIQYRMKDTTFKAKVTWYNGLSERIDLIVCEDTLPEQGLLNMIIN